MIEFRDRIEINKHKAILEHGRKFVELLHGEDKEAMLNIIRNSENYLDNTYSKENVLLNPTVREMATLKVSVKRYIRKDIINLPLSRIKLPSTYFEDIPGICAKCIRNEYNHSYDMCNKCFNKLIKRENIHQIQFKRRWRVEFEFNKAVKKTTFSDDLMGNWLLLMRKMKENKESKHIDNALKNFIRDELVKEFKEQNPKLMKKYGL